MLHTVPTDVATAIALHLAPSSLLSLTSTCRALRPLSGSPQIWQSLSARHFATSGGPARSAQGFASLCEGASARWRVTVGAVVADVPAHVRGGCAVGARVGGGKDRVVGVEKQEGFYVVQIGGCGGATAGSAPRKGEGEVEVDWKWKGVFPKSGVVVRVVGGVVGKGVVEVVVNGKVVGDGRGGCGVVGVSEVEVPGEMLRGLGEGNNVVGVRWVGEGAWWVREVEVVPRVLGGKRVEGLGRTLPVAVPGREGEVDMGKARRSGGVQVWNWGKEDGGARSPPRSPTSIFGV